MIIFRQIRPEKLFFHGKKNRYYKMTQDRILMFSMVHKLSCGLAQTSKSDYISRDFLKQSYVKDLN